MQISRAPAYTQLLELGRARPGAIFLEIGCCCEFITYQSYANEADSRSVLNLEVGSDMRKAVADGFPIQNCVASDLRPGSSSTTPFQRMH